MGFMVLIVANSVFASIITMNVKNNGDAIYLIEKGLQCTIKINGFNTSTGDTNKRVNVFTFI